MNAFDTDRIAGLARALGVPSRQLLVLAARIAREPRGDDPGHRRALKLARVPAQAAETTAALMMTPIASFAQDDLAAALALPLALPRAVDE